MQKSVVPFVISLHKNELCQVCGITPYQLRVILQKERPYLESLGYNKHCKLLMPNIVEEIVRRNRLTIDYKRMQMLFLQNG